MTGGNSYRDLLATDIAAFIESGETDAAAFQWLAHRLFAYQFEHNVPYCRFCDGRGISPSSIPSWRDIPAAPAAAFKRFALTCAQESECVPERGGRVFHSSGTTGAETSRHFMDSAALDLYLMSLREGYQRFVPAWTAGIFALMPHPKDAPHSSLSYMLDKLGAMFFSGEHMLLWMRVQRKPYTVFGTAFAWVHLLDTMGDQRLQLPEDCIVLETGGFKGRSREIERDELYALFTERLGVPSTHCVAEYGMSEMASQFYDSTLYDHVHKIARTPRKIGPPWVRTRVIDPVTGTDALPGQPGLLTHYDLANLNSVFAIQTEDYGVMADDGDGFILLGRAPGAVLRGCSLSAEELMARSGSTTGQV